MKEIKNQRLMMIARMMPRCKKFADIGTDHAWLPIYAVSSGISESAIAADIKKGPIAVAQKNISEYGMQGMIETRLGSGLSVLAAEDITDGNCEAAVIAGMGGLLICDILDADKDISHNLPVLILEPNTSEYELREYLYRNSYEILDEQACRDGRHVYAAIKCRFNGGLEHQGKINIEKKLEFFTGKVMPERKSDTDKLYFEKLRNKAIKVLSGMEQSENNSEENIQRMEIYRALLKRTEELLK
ncbi:MAG: SAM-dependent methyltransferase [Clostridia bacterium]|nr:SAM-dependent methyltransferase [Clostridia bacterium]